MSGIGSPTFELIDHHGNRVTHASFSGQWLMVYFGFTHCKVVCPRSLQRLSQVLESLPDSMTKKITPLYISVDPERDTPDVMKQYLETQYPRFTGLTGTVEQVEAAKQAFKVFAQRKPDPDDPDGYDVPHTAITYLVEPAGAYATHWVATKPANDIVLNLNQLLTTNPNH